MLQPNPRDVHNLNDFAPAADHPGVNTDGSPFSPEPDCSQEPSVRLTEPADVVCMVPHLLGFHPEDSIVVMACARLRLALTARIPLDMADKPADLARTLGLLDRRVPDAGWLVVGYGSDLLRVSTALTQVTQLLDESRVISCQQVDAGRYWEHGHPERPCQIVPEHSTAVTEAVIAGMVVAPDREALRERIAPPKGWAARRARERVECAREEVMTMGIADRVICCDALLDRAAVGLDTLSDDDLTLLGVLMHQPATRDIALKRLDHEHRWPNLALWQRVIRAMPVADQGPVLAVLGIACWVAGEGALQVICLERGKELAPNDRLLALLAKSTALALPPQLWFQVLDHLDEPV